MTRSIRRARGAFLLGTALATSGVSCSNQLLPGSSLGRYTFTGALGANTCGRALGAPNPWTFPVEVSRDGDTLYWSFLKNDPPISGVVGRDGDAKLTNAQALAVGNAGCTLSRTDTLVARIGASGIPSRFDGTLHYTFAVVGGADCSEQLTASGGTYDALPCTTAYTFTASK